MRTRSFREVLREHRIAAGLTQEELAERAKLSVRGVSDLERGLRVSPRSRTITLLAAALGLDDQQRRIFQSAARVADRRIELGTTGLSMTVRRLIGRDAEVSRVDDMTRSGALVTVVGPPGVGKTRLMLELGLQRADSFAEVVFVQLSVIRDAALIPTEIGRAMGLTESDDVRVADVAAEIGDRSVLLLLDNFEHLGGSGPLLDELLSRCARLGIIGTSRAPIGAESEVVFRLEPLPLDAAIELFSERMRAAGLARQLGAAAEDAIVAVCRALDGLPLALELAAAHSDLYTPSELLSQINAGPIVGLDDAIAWSIALLTRPERRALEALSLFPAASSLEAAAAVAALSEPDAARIFASLYRQSLVRSIRDQDDHTRFGMLSVIRATVRRDVDDAGVQLGVRRYVKFFADLVGELDESSRMGDDAAAARVVDRELENIREAVVLATEWARRDPEVLSNGIRLVSAMSTFWYRRGAVAEGIRCLDTFSAMIGDANEPDASLVTRAHIATAALATIVGDQARGFERAAEAIQRADATDLVELAVEARLSVAVALELVGQPDASVDLLTAALRRAESANRDDLVGQAALQLARVHERRGQLAEAAEVARSAISVTEGSRRWLLFGLLGNLELGLGRLRAAAYAYARWLHAWNTEERYRGSSVAHLDEIAELFERAANAKAGLAALELADRLRMLRDIPRSEAAQDRAGRLRAAITDALGAETVAFTLEEYRAIPQAQRFNDLYEQVSRISSPVQVLIP